MEKSELQRMLEFDNIRKQRELTLEEKKEGLRLFKKAVLEPDTHPLKSKTHTAENETPWAQQQAMRRQYEQLDLYSHGSHLSHTLECYEVAKVKNTLRSI